MKGTMDSPQQLWRTQFDKQISAEMIERVVNQTKLLVRKVEKRARWRDEQLPAERLNEVLLKLLDGRLKWDPERCDLERFLFMAIAGEISHDVERAVKRKHVSLDDESVNQDDLEHATSDAIASDRETKAEVPKDEWWTVALDEIRKHAAGDKGVLAIVDAYAHGATTRRDVLAYTKMTDRQYKAAYARMVRVSQKIDEDVREQILDAIV